MELNGALSNPRSETQLSLLRDVQKRLLRKAAAYPMEPRPAPVCPSPVLEMITRVLERENRPMHAREIHSAAGELLGRPLLWKSVKGTLSSYAQGHTQRFVRVGRGVYRLSVGCSTISDLNRAGRSKRRSSYGVRGESSRSTNGRWWTRDVHVA